MLCKGLSFCPAPGFGENDFSNDLFDFSRKLRLQYQFHKSTNEDPSIVKLPSNYTPPPNQDVELEILIHQLKTTRVRKTKDRNNNMTPLLQNALHTITEKVTDGDLIIKSADKGDVTVVMSSDYYFQMCMSELNKE